MKISTQWSKQDWDNALKKVWKLSRNFEEILNFGLEHNFITSSDIIHASDIYKDPNKEYDDEELKEIIKNSNIYDLMTIIQEEYSLEDIIGELPSMEILENIPEEDKLDSLEHTWTLDRHDEEIRNQTYNECVDEWIYEMRANKTDQIKKLQEANPDELHKLICNIIGTGYYDPNTPNKIMELLNKNTYGIKYERNLIPNYKVEYDTNPCD